MLIVALPNVDRNRDFLPTKVKNIPTSGKADDFLAFFKKELIPYIDANYNVAPFRILYGHSFGGVFNFHALFSEPKLFNAHIAVSPSLWFDDKLLVKKAEKFFKKKNKFNGFLYYTIGGNEGARMKNNANSLYDILKQNTPNGYDWEYQLIPDETHGTVPHISVYKALRKLFRNWRYNAFKDRDEQSLDRLLLHYRTLSTKYGYTILPSEGAVNNFGYMLVRIKKFKKAVKVFTYNVKHYPKSPNVYDSLGEMYENMGNFNSARVNYNKAVKLGTKMKHAQLNVFKRNLKRVRERSRKKREK